MAENSRKKSVLRESVGFWAYAFSERRRFARYTGEFRGFFIKNRTRISRQNFSARRMHQMNTSFKSRWYEGARQKGTLRLPVIQLYMV